MKYQLTFFALRDKFVGGMHIIHPSVTSDIFSFKKNWGDGTPWFGHISPGIYSRAFLEGRITEAQMLLFRQEAGKDGLVRIHTHG